MGGRSREWEEGEGLVLRINEVTVLCDRGVTDLTATARQKLK